MSRDTHTHTVDNDNDDDDDDDDDHLFIAERRRRTSAGQVLLWVRLRWVQMGCAVRVDLAFEFPFQQTVDWSLSVCLSVCPSVRPFRESKETKMVAVVPYAKQATAQREKKRKSTDADGRADGRTDELVVYCCRSFLVRKLLMMA